MGQASNAFLAGGVFTVVFAASWWALPGLTPKSPADEPMAFANKPAEVIGTFQEVLAGDERGSAGPVTGKAAMAAQEDNEARMVLLAVRMKGHKASLEFIKAAQNDAPPNPALVRYAVIDAGSGKKTACVSTLSDGRVEHGQTTYSATEIDDNDGSAQLAQYILSGCAQAIRDHAKVLTHVQYLQQTSAILPKTRAYDAERQQIVEMIRSIRRGQR